MSEQLTLSQQQELNKFKGWVKSLKCNLTELPEGPSVFTLLVLGAMSALRITKPFELVPTGPRISGTRLFELLQLARLIPRRGSKRKLTTLRAKVHLCLREGLAAGWYEKTEKNGDKKEFHYNICWAGRVKSGRYFEINLD